MDRVRKQWQAEAISFGIGWLAPPIQWQFESRHTDFFCGDPIFAGVHDHEHGTGEIELPEEERRSNRYISHCAYSYLVSDGTTTIVLPDTDPEETEWNYCLYTLIHEAGHAVHEVLEFADYDLPCVTEYAERNWCETFAEAFTLYHIPPGQGWDHLRDKLSRDDLRLFDFICNENGLWRPSWMDK